MNPKYKLIATDQQLLDLGDALVLDNNIVSLDCETTGLYKDDLLVGISISWAKDQGIYAPLNHQSGPLVSLDAMRLFLRKIKALRIVYHNAKFDRLMIYSNTGVLLPVFADTMVYAFILSEPKSLKDLSFKFLNKMQVKFASLMSARFGRTWAKSGFKFWHFPSDDPESLDYACEDADNTLQLFNLLRPLMTNHRSILKIEEGLEDIVLKMNYTGALVDPKMLIDATAAYEDNIRETYNRITAAAGREVKINSNKDLSKFLFEELKLPILSRSRKTKAPSTDKDTLAELALLNPICADIDSWRKETRMLKAYITKIPAGMDSNNYIHTSFNNTGAVSGRFTSSSVKDQTDLIRGLNFQNIPKSKGNRRIDMRAAFIAPEGFTFVKADYSQIEYRVTANLAQEPYMIDNFNKGVDFHTQTGAIMHGVPIENLPPAYRADGKVFNFGLIYGMTPKGLANLLGCSEEEAGAKMSKYFDNLPNLVGLINAAKARAKVEGKTSTFFGRERPIITAGLPPNYKDKALRQAFNTMIQGTAADLLKIAMLRVKGVLAKYRDDLRLAITVHDELDFYVRTTKLQEINDAIIVAMEIPVPDNWAKLKVDLSYGVNWSEDFHTKYVPSESLVRDTFTSWADVIPAEFNSTSVDELAVA